MRRRTDTPPAATLLVSSLSLASSWSLVSSLAFVSGLSLAGCGGPAADRRGLSDKVAVTLDSFHEAVIRPDGTLTPMILDREFPLAVCLAAPPSADTSQWRAALYFTQAGSSRRWNAGATETPTFQPPLRRRGSTLCFGTLATGVPTGELKVCGQLSDPYSDTIDDLPCRPVVVSDELTTHREIRSSMSEVLRQGLAIDPLVAALDGLATGAETRGFPLLALRIRLIAAHFLRRDGGEQTSAAVKQRLDSLPSWLETGDIAAWAAQVAYERATLALGSPDRLQEAWQHLKRSELEYARIAHGKTIATIAKQAEILMRIGIAEEARSRLATALVDCPAQSCDPSLEAQSRGTYAWWLLEKPDATADELETVATNLQRALAGTGDSDPVVRANILVDHAYLDLRRGNDPAKSLQPARALLSGNGSEKARRLEHWSIAIEGLHALERGEEELAARLCSSRATDLRFPHLAARALSCLGQARRLQGELAAAADAFERAFDLYEFASPARLGLRMPLGPGQRADDYYRAARLAVERGLPEEAWEILVQLDAATADEEARQRCAVEQIADDRQRSALLAELMAVEVPAAGPRREQRRSIRRSLRRQLQELARRQEGCLESPAASDQSQIRFRAFALTDEVLLLERDLDAEVRVHRRTRTDRREIRQSIDRLTMLLDIPVTTEAEWIAAAEPLSRALVPDDPTTLDSLTTFALHGLLQAIPMAALPVNAAATSDPATSDPATSDPTTSDPATSDPVTSNSATSAPEPTWLTDWTTIALAPAGAVAQQPRAINRRPLVVTNPTGNLGRGLGLGSEYARRFPTATVLEGHAAETRRVLAEIDGASWLHVDAHGTYDPAFPDLSSIRLADGTVTGADFVGRTRGLAFANLSACQTGRWPTTANSGSYGTGGLLTRLGVPWVIASRSKLENTMAIAFNRYFYEHIADGGSAPQAYATANRRVREVHPVARWAALQLLRGLPPAADQTNGSPPTPVGVRGSVGTETGDRDQ